MKIRNILMYTILKIHKQILSNCRERLVREIRLQKVVRSDTVPKQVFKGSEQLKIL